MNSLYIGVGLAVILALVTALVGPLFVDWGTHRAVFEAEASRIVGLPVKVLGDVDARLLPAPRVRFGDVVIGDLDRPIARVGRFELDLDVAGLIRGETRVSDLVLDRPGLDLEIDSAGRLVGLPAGAADLAGVRIETMRFVDGRVRITDRRATATWTIDKIEGRGAIESLAGAFRLEARGVSGGAAATLRVAARRVADGPHLRFSAGFGDGAVEATGDVALGAAGDRPRLEGPVTLTAAAAGDRPAVSGSGALRLDPDGASLADLALRIGAEEGGLALSGDAELRFGAIPSATVRLGARRLDLDGAAGAGEGGARVRVGAARGTLAPLLAVGVLPRATRVAIDVDTVALAGGLVSEVSIEAATRAGGLTIDRFAARLPGETRLGFSGRLDFAEEVLRGTGRLSTAAPETLVSWWTGAPAGEAAIGEVSAAGSFATGRDGFVGSDLDLTLAGAVARGRAEVRTDGLVRLGLSAGRLDGRRLAALAGRLGAGGLPARGLDLDLDVREATLGALAARGTRISLHVDAGALAIDRLVVTDLAGARIAASGRITDPWSAPEGRIEGRVTAERPGPAARALLEVVAPRAAGLGETIATAAGPLDLTMTIEGRHGAETGAGSLGLTVSGRAAEGDLGLSASWEGPFDDPLRGRFEGRLASTGARLSEAAARLLEAKPNEAVTLSGSMSGRPSEGMTVGLDAALADRRLTVSGKLAPDPAGAPSARLAVHVAAPDVGGLADLFGRPVAALEGRLPIDLSGTIAGWGGRWSVAGLGGHLGDTRLSGEGTVDLQGLRPKVSGRLGLGETDLAVLADVALAAPFDFDVATSVERLAIDATHTATEVGARLAGRDGAVTIDDLAARIDTARLGGGLRATRAEGVTTLSGTLTGAIDAISVAGAGGRPALTGRLSGEIGFEAKGADAAGLIGSASGSGRVRLDGGRLAGFDAARLAAPRDGEGSAEAILAAMAGATASLDPVDLSILLEKGVIRAPHVEFGLAGARASGRLSADLGTGRLDGLLSLEPVGEGVAMRASAISHALPTLDLRLTGSLATPHLRSDGATLAAFLTLHRVERDIEAADVQRQDRIERMRFSTLLKRIEERRRAREAAAAAPLPPPDAAKPIVVPAPMGAAGTAGTPQGVPQ